MLFLPYGTLQEVSKLKDCIPDRQFVSILKDFRKALGSVRVSKLFSRLIHSFILKPKATVVLGMNLCGPMLLFLSVTLMHYLDC